MAIQTNRSVKAGAIWRQLARERFEGCEDNEANRIGCTIALVSTGPQLIRPQEAQERSWLPIVAAVVIVLAVAIGLVLYYEHGKSAPAVTPISAALDPYAGSLTISNLHMSESANLAGGTVTQALNLIRTREPYVDVEPVSAAPLKPGDSADFRLVFDTIAQDWDGTFPEIRVIHVEAK
jgi:hypothetical protein